jgi:hypothetical protein
MNIMKSRLLQMHTSVYLEHIFEIASLTSICDSVKPEVSMIRRHDVTEKALCDVRGLEIMGSVRLQIGRRNLDADAIARCTYGGKKISELAKEQ